MPIVQNETTVRDHFTSAGILPLERLTRPHVGEDVKQLGLSLVAGGSMKLYRCSGMLFGSFSET